MSLDKHDLKALKEIGSQAAGTNELLLAVNATLEDVVNQLRALNGTMMSIGRTLSQIRQSR